MPLKIAIASAWSRSASVPSGPGMVYRVEHNAKKISWFDGDPDLPSAQLGNFARGVDLCERAHVNETVEDVHTAKLARLWTAFVAVKAINEVVGRKLKLFSSEGQLHFI